MTSLLFTGVALLFAIFVRADVQTNTFPVGVLTAECRLRHFWMLIHKDFLPEKWELQVFDPAEKMYVVITTALATQCGYTISQDAFQNVEIRISFLACLVQNENDYRFTLHAQINAMHHDGKSSHLLVLKCDLGTTWKTREIVCEENYMEVSVKRQLPDFQDDAEQDWYETIPLAQLAQSQVWQVVFHYPDTKPTEIIPALDVQKMGYTVNTTGTRVFLRAPYGQNQSYVEMVEGIPIEMVRATVLYRQMWMVILVDAALGCSINTATFSNTTLTWMQPRVLYPLIPEFVQDNRSISIGGTLLDNDVILQRGYFLQLNRTVYALTIPLGAEGGYLKSDVVDNVYGITYTINVVKMDNWMDSHKDVTEHRLFRLIKTPFLPQAPVFINNTDPSMRTFNITLGNFLTDVELTLLTIKKMPLTPGEAINRGYVLSEVPSPTNTKEFVLQIPFSDGLVKQKYVGGTTRRYTLQLTYTLNIVPENKLFTYPVTVECDLEDVVLPVAKGYCSNEKLILAVTHGNMDSFWAPYIEDQELTPWLATQRNYMTYENGTHFLLELPLFSPGVTYQDITLYNVTARLDLTLRDIASLEERITFSVTCTFLANQVLVCFSNGTITATVLGNVTVPPINPQKTRLRDGTCTPTHSDSQRALFHFSVTSCGTTVKIDSRYINYENEISLKRELIPLSSPVITRETEYSLTLICRYPVNDTKFVHADLHSNSFSVSRHAKDSVIGQIKVGRKLRRQVSRLHSSAEDGNLDTIFLDAVNPHYMKSSGKCIFLDTGDLVKKSMRHWFGFCQ
ncbi:uncharacterized protein LOC122805848 isoform X2 [Protopterus annectens]|uniref:uncharacterized protein LOC122805848 isoform X2 n=1 Tax=Protopterus annectens TaxID=7888 RepID=UPI001CFB3DD5|nr:uncharacterized protein LOC122805848 isoform X2 [Protopterus annectens]